MPTPERIQHLIQAYAEGPALLEAAVRSIPNEELTFKPGPEHWSIHENIIHLADTDLVAAQRIRYILAQPGLALIAFDQNAWAQALDYASQSFDDALTLFHAIRTTTSHLLRRAPASSWESVGMHNESGPQTLEYIVEHYADHVHYHLRTIAKRRRQYAELRGART